MKKLFCFVALVLFSGFSMTAYAQAQTYEVSNPCVELSGDFIMPAYSWLAPPCYQGFPVYTPTVTVTNTANDTMDEKIGGYHNAVYTWMHATGLTGTNTSCIATLYVSADSGRGVDWVPIYTNTVTATNPVAYKLVDGGAGWNYTNLRWVFDGVGTHTTTYYCGLMVRFKEETDMWDGRRKWRTNDSYVLQ